MLDARDRLALSGFRIEQHHGIAQRHHQPSILRQPQAGHWFAELAALPRSAVDVHCVDHPRRNIAPQQPSMRPVPDRAFPHAEPFPYKKARLAGFTALCHVPGSTRGSAGAHPPDGAAWLPVPRPAGGR